MLGAELRGPRLRIEENVSPDVGMATGVSVGCGASIVVGGTKGPKFILDENVSSEVGITTYGTSVCPAAAIVVGDANEPKLSVEESPPEKEVILSPIGTTVKGGWAMGTTLIGLSMGTTVIGSGLGGASLHAQ